MTMNRLIILILILALYSCKEKSKPIKAQNDKYFFLEYRHEHFDTLKIGMIFKYENEFKPIDTINYWLNHKPITIIKLSNEPAPTDGGMIAYWEKSVGVFYQKSTTWYQYFRLKSSNDSINDFIGSLYGFVLLHPDFGCTPRKTSKLKFIPPTLTEQGK